MQTITPQPAPANPPGSNPVSAAVAPRHAPTSESASASGLNWLPKLSALGAVGAVLEGCGGGALIDDASAQSAMVFASAITDTGFLSRQRRTAAQGTTSQSTASQSSAAPSTLVPTTPVAVDANAFMDWAQAVLPDYFSGKPATVSAQVGTVSYVYRLYASTGHVIAVTSDGKCYIVGPITAGQLKYVGVLTDFTCAIYPDRCTGPGAWAAPNNLTESARFLAQATLGAPKAQISELMNLTYAGWLDAQFALPQSQSHFDWLVAKGYNTDTYINNAQGLDNTIWRKLVSGTDVLRQKMVLALSEICVVSVLGINGQWRQFATAHYLDILDANAFGNYRTLLEQLSRSPAMGFYLTFRGNAKTNASTGSQPDENYARELMQLFTIGLSDLNADGTLKLTAGKSTDSYDQDDVSGLARVFTGWDLDLSGLTAPYPPDTRKRQLVSVASRYETGAKTFLGTTIPAGTSAVVGLGLALDALFNHANVPPFVCKQLIQRLVTSNPTPAYVGRVAAVFVNNGSGVRGDLKAVLKAILLDTEARDPANVAAASFGKLREPVVRFLNWARAFGAASPSDNWAIGDLSDPATKLGQSPARSGSVFNFFRPGYVPPGSALATQNLLGPEFQITTESSVAGYINFMQGAIAGSRVGDVRASYASLLALASDSTALLDELNLVLAAGQIDATTLASLKTALDTIAVLTDAGKLNRVYAALTLVLATPQYIAQK